MGANSPSNGRTVFSTAKAVTKGSRPKPGPLPSICSVSIKASPNICRPPHIPSTMPPAAAWAAMAASSCCVRSQAISAAVALLPGKMIQSAPCKSPGLRAQTSCTPAQFFKGWNSSRLLMRGYAITAILLGTNVFDAVDCFAALAMTALFFGAPPLGLASNTPSSSGRPWPYCIGITPKVGTPVRCCKSSGAGASKLASPLNLFSTKPLISGR